MIVSGGATTQYDNNGNQVYKATETIKPVTEGETESISGFVAGESADGTNVTFNQYNGFNQLIKTTAGDKTIDYTYNGDGLRTSKTVNDVTTTHIWDGGQIVLELDGAGSVTGKYVRGINLLYAEDGAGTNRKWYLFNGHGDVVQLTGTDGNVTKIYDYDAFGNEKDPDPNDTNVFRYCGEYFDKETGTIYLRARYYDASIGRFISEDSFWGKDNDPLSLNLYVYCGNNPVIYFDFNGHWKKEVHYNMTKDWATSIFENEDYAEIIAYACNSVDSGDTSPLNFYDNDAMGWHFNRNGKGEIDSRMQNFKNSYNEAVNLWNSSIVKGYEDAKVALDRGYITIVEFTDYATKQTEGYKRQALTTFGEGLHALQDIFAHQWYGFGTPFILVPHNVTNESIFSAITGNSKFDNTGYDLVYDPRNNTYRAVKGTMRITTTQEQTEYWMNQFLIDTNQK